MISTFSKTLLIVAIVFRSCCSIVDDFFPVEPSEKIQNCTCVPFFQCSDKTGNVITDGQGLIDFRQFRNKKCIGYFDVCCNLLKTPSEDSPKNCGQFSYGGFPWLVTILLKNNPKFVPSEICKATLIHKQVVVTSAHCLINSGSWSARLADDTDVAIKKIFLHPRFNPETLENDVALVVLDYPVTFNKKVSAICLPDEPKRVGNASCLGVFKTTFGKVFPKMEEKACGFPKISGIRCGHLPSDCLKNDGAPLVRNLGGNRYEQLAIISGYVGKEGRDSTSVFVNLSVYLDWIDEVIFHHFN